jgi:cobalt-zinc-cadmium efflux system outer membrane protein
MSLEQGQKLEAVASQRVNPEVSSKGLYGKAQDEQVINFEASLVHTFELGGKRSARITQASVRKNWIGTQLLGIEEQVYLNTLISLYRLRQIQSQLHVIGDTLATFSRIINQYRLRAKLTPEQEVSLSVFQLAQGDAQLKKSSLLSEQVSVEKKIELAIGKPLPTKIEKIFPSERRVWPSVGREGDTSSSFENAKAKTASAKYRMAEADLDIAKSMAWPDLKVGPAFQAQTQGVFNYASYGLAMTVTLPIFHQNGAGRAAALYDLSVAEKNSELVYQELTSEKASLLRNYENAVSTLKNLPPVSEIEQKHMKIENLFSRGVIPSSLFIEAHRQTYEFFKSKYELESSAVEYLNRIYAMEGRLFKEKI